VEVNIGIKTGNLYEMNKSKEEMWNKLKEPSPTIDEYDDSDDGILDDNGNRYWFDKDGKRHRDNDLPAIIWKDGSKFWFKHGQYIRVEYPK